MFIGALCTKVKIGKQSVHQEINEVWGIYIYIYVYVCMQWSITQLLNELLPFAITWMDREGIMLNKMSQRKTNTTHFHLYVESEKSTNE